MSSTSERLKDVRAARRSMVVRRVVAVLMLILFLIAAYLFVNSAYFMIGEVKVTGNKYMTSDEILSVAGIPEKSNIFRLNVANVQDRLTKDLRIASVNISRSFPSTLVLEVSERQPYAYIATNYGFVEVDKEGMVLAASRTLKNMNVPIITGIKLGNLYVGDQIQSEPVKQSLEFLSALSDQSLNLLSEVNISDPQQLQALTIHSVQVRIGQPERLSEKAQFANQILSEIGDKTGLAEFIDL
ncbi:MAG: FtsQ-type POTRA domain-containing protein, partial [Sporomusaceae bacterium]|nr:FtsQ-type POTRA domain-containing protein [Sporomusaceae bacterium]